MKALRFDRIGSLDALDLDDVPEPRPGEGEVLVQVLAAGVNPSDFKNVLGKFPYTTVPRTPGRDFAGVVVDGPADLVGIEVWGSGRELGFTRDGSHSERLVIPAAAVTAKPTNLSFAEAAACGVPYLTAHEALERTGVGPDTGVLLIGMGAVGTAAYALAVARGARTAVGVRRAEHADALRARGVTVFLLGDVEEFAARARDHFGGGADVVLDTTGFWLPAAIPVLGQGGRVAVIAAPADGHERVPVLGLYRMGASIVGVNSALHDTIAGAAALATLCGAFEAGILPAPSGIVTRNLEEAVETYRDMAAGSTDKYVFAVDR